MGSVLASQTLLLSLRCCLAALGWGACHFSLCQQLKESMGFLEPLSALARSFG